MRGRGDYNGIYQIYPRSFMDSNADGIGDLPGITSRLEYIKGSVESLGVDMIWLSPFYPSPMADFGYDVSDYRGVDRIFGTLNDIDELTARAHELNIAVMVDLVPNHTSEEHPWFIESASSRDNPKRDWYTWHDPAPDGGPPNNWLSVFGGSAWEYHEPTGQYYLHSFLKEQPDLNWLNPEVEQEMAATIRYWFEKGVDGIRVDAIRWIGKDPDLTDDPQNDMFQEGQDPYHAVRHHYSRFSPVLDRALRVMTDVANEYHDKIIIFEDHLDTLTPLDSQIRRIYSIDPGVSAPFNFQGMHIPFSSRAFSDMVNEYQTHVPAGAREFYCFSNHDESRLTTRFGDSQARMLAVLQLMLPGTPVIYYGQEIGMTDGVIAPDQVQDPFEKRVPGKGLGRDPERTPMQWNPDRNAGFSDADSTWLPVNPNYETVNVEAERQLESSSFHLYRKLLELRKVHSEIRTGTYEHHLTTEDVYSFWRYDNESVSASTFLTVLNFSDSEQVVDVLDGGTVILSAQQNTYERPGETITVQPFDGVVIRYN